MSKTERNASKLMRLCGENQNAALLLEAMIFRLNVKKSPRRPYVCRSEQLREDAFHMGPRQYKSGLTELKIRNLVEITYQTWYDDKGVAGRCTAFCLTEHCIELLKKEGML